MSTRARRIRIGIVCFFVRVVANHDERAISPKDKYLNAENSALLRRKRVESRNMRPFVCTRPDANKKMSVNKCFKWIRFGLLRKECARFVIFGKLDLRTLFSVM